MCSDVRERSPFAPGPGASMLQQQLVDLLALAASLRQTRWTVRGSESERVGARLHTAADAVGDLAEQTARHMVVCGYLPNGNPLAQLISEVDIRAPEWWPAQEGAALAAADLANLERATSGRATSLDEVAPPSAQLLESQAATLHEQRLALTARPR
jgi:DNA-binding ferritin-like protein